MEEAIYLKI